MRQVRITMLAALCCTSVVCGSNPGGPPHLATARQAHPMEGVYRWEHDVSGCEAGVGCDVIMAQGRIDIDIDQRRLEATIDTGRHGTCHFAGSITEASDSRVQVAIGECTLQWVRFDCTDGVECDHHALRISEAAPNGCADAICPESMRLLGLTVPVAKP